MGILCEGVSKRRFPHGPRRVQRAGLGVLTGSTKARLHGAENCMARDRRVVVRAMAVLILCPHAPGLHSQRYEMCRETVFARLLPRGPIYPIQHCISPSFPLLHPLPDLIPNISSLRRALLLFRAVILHVGAGVSVERRGPSFTASGFGH